MSTTVDRVSVQPLAVPTRIGQATAVEQARAVAEVQAAVIVAQQCPRDMMRAWAEMRAACGRLALASRAFYSVPNRGTGPSVHLARELARIWGNLDYGVRELRRDDERGESEIQAFAWDQQTNVRSTRSLIAPHARMKKVNGQQTREPLIDLTDVYLNNQNIGARAVRECVFTVLPADFVAEAQELCRTTIERGDGQPLDKRINDMVSAFGTLGVSVGQIETRVGRKRGQWTAGDVADLGVVFSSIKRRDVTAEDEFPIERVTVEEVTKPKSAPKSKAKPADMDPLAWRDEALHPDTPRERLGQMLAAVIGTGEESPVVVNENGDDEPLVVLIDRVLADRHLGGGPML